MFISHEICVRLAHNKYVHVLLENPREGRRKQNQIDYPESPKRTNSSSQVKQQDFHRELFFMELNRCLLVFSAGTQTLKCHSVLCGGNAVQPGQQESNGSGGGSSVETNQA